MNTADVPIIVHPSEAADSLPAWALPAVRLGVRRALELLRSPILPDEIVVAVSGDIARLTTTPRHADGRGLFAFDARRIVISYPATVSEEFLAAVDFSVRDPGRRALAYAAAAATAMYVQCDDLTGTEDEAHFVAVCMAAAATGFTLMPSGVIDQRLSFLPVQVFLSRLAEIRQRDGLHALWRGEVGAAVRDFVDNVAFGREPGTLTSGGQRVALTEIQTLVDYAEGAGPWPFATAKAG